MRNLIAILLISFFLLLSINCKKEKKVEFNPNNHLQKISKVEMQSFELDTISISKIQGKNGTEIWFVREAFDVTENQNITVELKEFYDFEELIFNNINTVTNQGELLESSGVIYLDFIADGKSLKLKKGSRIGIRFPENKLAGNNIYSGTVDSINQFSWTKEDIFVGVMEFDKEYAIDILKIIPRDSLEFYYQDMIPETIPGQVVESEFYSITGSIFINRFKWINIDMVITPERRISFELLTSNTDLENFNIFFLYSDLNSFVSNFRTIDNLVFENVPIKNQTSLIIIGKSKEQYFMDMVNLTEVFDENIDLKFKKTSLDEIQKLLEQ